MTASPVFQSIAEIATRLRAGDLSASRLLEAYAERIERFAGTSKAFITLDLDRAREKAAAMGKDLRGRSALAGIPYACKDLFDVRGLPTTAGSRVLENNIATRDADAIERMDAAGAILVGKNNLHEFAYGATGENRVYGTPPNPRDASRLAGGSSSGSAAAVAYGLCAAALGTDTGGSVRAPAALCGLVGFKPTFGRVSSAGVIPYSWTLDHVGTLTRSAADAASLFEVLAARCAGIDATRLDGLAIGLPDRFFFERCDSEILERVDDLKNFLQRAGARLRPVSLPDMEYTRSVSLTVQMPEALSYHDRYLEKRGEFYSADFRAGLALGQCLRAEQYIRAKRFIESYRRDMNRVFDEVDVILTPATPVIAPRIGAVDIEMDGVTEPAGNAITRYTSFFNMTGHPAITLPCGMHGAGLPISVQLIGPHHADERLLGIAICVEQAYEFEIAPPDL